MRGWDDKSSALLEAGLGTNASIAILVALGEILPMAAKFAGDHICGLIVVRRVVCAIDASLAWLNGGKGDRRLKYPNVLLRLLLLLLLESDGVFGQGQQFNRIDILGNEKESLFFESILRLDDTVARFIGYSHISPVASQLISHVNASLVIDCAISNQINV